MEKKSKFDALADWLWAELNRDKLSPAYDESMFKGMYKVHSKIQEMKEPRFKLRVHSEDSGTTKWYFTYTGEVAVLALEEAEKQQKSLQVEGWLTRIVPAEEYDD